VRALASMTDRRGCWTSTPPLRTRPHLNGASPGVKVEGPRGVVVAAVKGGGGGVAARATTTATDVAATGSTVVVSPLSTPRLLRVVIVGHRRQWRSTPGGGSAEGGLDGRPLGFGSSGSEKKGT
jgi:hypothetical protein